MTSHTSTLLSSGPARNLTGSRPVRVLDLFSGAGGLSEGFRQASDRYAVVRAVEMDTPAAASYAANHSPEVVYNGAIQNWVRDEEIPDVDVVIGGPPCQGFSTLGKRDANDVRNALWEYYVLVVRQARPLFFVMENVPAFEKSPQYALFSRSFRSGGLLEQYDFRTVVLNAADYGTPQVRRRVVVIGWDTTRVSDPGLPAITNPNRGAWRTVGDAIGHLPPNPIATQPATERTYFFAGRTLKGAYRSDELHLIRRYESISLARFADIPYGGNRNDIHDSRTMECWRQHKTGAGDVMGRMVWEKPSVTIRTEYTKPEKGRYLHPVSDRAISIHEGARLQGFPDDYLFVGSLTAITKQIGNAVPIPLGRALGRLLLPGIDTPSISRKIALRSTLF